MTTGEWILLFIMLGILVMCIWLLSMMTFYKPKPRAEALWFQIMAKKNEGNEK